MSYIYTVNGQEFELKHYGVKGMKWGVRRMRNILGMGGARGGAYGDNQQSRNRIGRLTGTDTHGTYGSNKRSQDLVDKMTGRNRKKATEAPQDEAARKEANRQKAKRAMKIGAAVVAAGLAVYGAKKLHDVVREGNRKYHMDQADKMIQQMKKASLERGAPSKVKDVVARNAETAGKLYERAGAMSRKDNFGTAARNAAQYYRNRRRR